MSEKEIKIKTFKDIIRILREKPEWMEELRRLVLTEEILDFPKNFERFEEKEFKPLKEKTDKIEKDVGVLKEDVGVLKEDVKVLKEDVNVLKEDVKILKEDVEVLKEDVKVLKEDVKILKEEVFILKGDVKKMKDDISELKGDNLERRAQEKAPAFFGKLIKKCRVIKIEDLQVSLDEAEEKGIIKEEERDKAVLIDLVVSGNLKEGSKEKVLLAVEVSYKIDEDDVFKAEERAKIIEKVYKIKTIGVVLGKEISEKAKIAASELAVLII